MPSAFFCPISTASFLPRVMPCKEPVICSLEGKCQSKHMVDTVDTLNPQPACSVTSTAKSQAAEP
jgi:hypothetical protein